MVCEWRNGQAGLCILVQQGLSAVGIRVLQRPRWEERSLTSGVLWHASPADGHKWGFEGIAERRCCSDCRAHTVKLLVCSIALLRVAVWL